MLMNSQMLNGFGIAITRPTDQAKKLKMLISASGGQTIDFPLIDITGLNDYSTFNKAIANLNKIDWLIFISSNAVQNAMPRIQASYPSLPERCNFAAIGPVTAQELHTFGVQKVLIPRDRFDSESLLSMPEMQDMHNRNVLIVRGIGGREVLAAHLKSRGGIVTFAECYQRINPQTDCQRLKKAYYEDKCHAIVVTSSEAMQHLVLLAQAEDNWHLDQHWLKQIKICVNHARISEHESLKGLQIYIAQMPGDEAMLDCLTKALNP